MKDMQRISLWLWLALAGGVIQISAIASDYYIYEEESRGAWMGVPHTSELMLAAALVTIVLFALTAIRRSPLRGRNVGLLIGVLGLLASAQLGYRMVAPPFEFELGTREIMRLTGSCLVYCSPAQAADATLLPGIWMGLAGNLAVLLGGFGHALSGRARRTQPNFWVAERQAGMNPWLGLAALGAVGQFVLGYTFFIFYVTPRETRTIEWSGWLPTPHTSVVVLWVTILVGLLVYAASRGRSPLNSAALGGAIAVLGFVSGSRILYRVIEPPFGGGTAPARIALPAFLSLASAGLVIVAGIVHAVLHREPPEEEAVYGDPKADATFDRLLDDQPGQPSPERG
ncbi:MAG: hypothetical protein M3133_01405 [Actinomycetota bacterium]|nr:hypothetical protein [Actinomycetota bacterium]